MFASQCQSGGGSGSCEFPNAASSIHVNYSSVCWCPDCFLACSVGVTDSFLYKVFGSMDGKNWEREAKRCSLWVENWPLVSLPLLLSIHCVLFDSGNLILWEAQIPITALICINKPIFLITNNIKAITVWIKIHNPPSSILICSNAEFKWSH